MEVKTDPKTRKIEKRVQQAKEGVVRDTKHALFPEKKSGHSYMYDVTFLRSFDL